MHVEDYRNTKAVNGLILSTVILVVVSRCCCREVQQCIGTGADVPSKAAIKSQDILVAQVITIRNIRQHISGRVAAWPS